MFNEPILYDSPAFENASLAVLFCRELLSEKALTKEAQQLQGLDVTCPAMARVALSVLNGFRVKEDDVAVLIDAAQYLCEVALGQHHLRAAS